MTDTLAARFSDPPATWRAIPFWSLNDRLDPAEIARQLEEFVRGGFGGAYLHSRIGLLTPYLGDEWWRAMDAGVAACKRLGIEAWFYDEDKWPSGFAGGIVPLKDVRNRAKWLERIPLAEPVPETGVVIAEDAAWRYVCCTAQLGDAWFNGTCWVDLLDPEMVRDFIDCTYKPYAQRYVGEPRNIVRGIFTDEPQVNPKVDTPGAARRNAVLPYSPIVRDDFRARNGYDFAARAAALFEDGPGCEKVRLDYFRTIAWRFEQSFSVQIGDYCAQNGLTWTGHYNGEEHPHSILRNVGNMMIQYRHMQQPGIDHLGLHFATTWNHCVHAMRALSSVANQYGQERRLSEMFGVSGQNMDFEDRAWIADGHAVLGINHICPHLSLYTLKGCRKRDYPPTISPQQPWWGSNSLAEERMARVAMLSSQGRYAPEVLVIHPLESGFVDVLGGTSVAQERMYAHFNEFLAVLMQLQETHRDYDLGDEQILSEIGTLAGRSLAVGRMSYAAVVLPPLRTVRASTLALCEVLTAAGGTVLAVDRLPAMVDGDAGAEAMARVRRVLRLVPLSGLAALTAAVPPAVALSGVNAGQVWTHRRDVDGSPLVMLFNRSRLVTARVQVRLAGLGEAVLWDPATGARLALPSGTPEVELAPAQTLFVGAARLCPAAERTGSYALPGAELSRLAVAGPWRGERRDPDAITLDVASASTDGGRTWGPAEPVIAIHDRFTVGQWSGRLLLRFAVEVDAVPRSADLVVEQPEMYRRIAVNGRELRAEPGRFWRDHQFRLLDAAGTLRQGANAIELELDYIAPIPTSADAVARYGTEIESIYLIGDFAVAATVSPEPPAPTQRAAEKALPPVAVHRLRSFRIAAESCACDGDLALHGYPFFAGSFALSTGFDLPAVRPGSRYALRLPRPDAIVVHPRLNGRDLPPLAWSPWEVDITDAVRAGRNELTLTLVNSLRNLLGPHHHRDGELTKVGPDSFTGRTSWTSGGPGDADWYDVRLVREPRTWRDDYHVVAFGLGGAPQIIERRA